MKFELLERRKVVRPVEQAKILFDFEVDFQVSRVYNGATETISGKFQFEGELKREQR
jgi:hypothetical protein